MYMVAEAGTSKLWGDPGLHNKPLGCGGSEVYASGPACEEEEGSSSPRRMENPRRAQILFTPRRKPEITQRFKLSLICEGETKQRQESDVTCTRPEHIHSHNPSHI